MNTGRMNGLEILKSIQEGRIAPGGMAGIVPLELVEVERGHVTFHTRADARHTNPFGSVHGGFAATVLDSVTACAIHTMLDAGVGHATLDLNIKMLKPIPLEKELVGEGKTIHLSKTVGLSEGTLKDADGNLYAHATAIIAIKR
jgi:uncharacterized protein (TIGR00369 family)